MNDIIDLRNKPTDFFSLINGDCFLYNGSIFMQIRGDCAVNLKSGRTERFDKATTVMPVDITINIIA